MSKSKLMREVEAKIGQPLEEALPRLYEEGGIAHICRVLGIKRTTAFYWLLRFGFVVDRKLRRRV